MTFHISVQRSSSAMRLVPGMPEFAKSEFSVIRLHEVKIMRKIRKQEWDKFYSERGWKISQMHCLCPGLHLVTWCDTRKSTICRLHHSTKGKGGIYTERFIDSSRLKGLWTKAARVQGWDYRIEKLSNANISDFSVYRRVYRIEPPISSIWIFSKPVILLSFFRRKFRKFPESSENPWT